MKKSLLFLIGAFAVSALQAQWVNDPTTNTKLGTALEYGVQIYTATYETTGDTYVQWEGSNSSYNGSRAICLQRIDVDGVLQWGSDGIHIDSHQLATYTEGYAMNATSDGGVVTSFANYEKECIAMKFDKNGNTLWGEQGISVFDFPLGSYGCSRVELLAGTDGGTWVLAFDRQDSYLRYINADGTLNPTVTISDPEDRRTSCHLTPGSNGIVFVTYELLEDGDVSGYDEKQIWVTGFTTDGNRAINPTKLMDTLTAKITDSHYGISDGNGGGYVYIFHSGIAGVQNTYVFHYDANGTSTISDPYGAMVHTIDLAHHYYSSHATVDPVSHDIILVYLQTTSGAQTNHKLNANRITPTGEVLWDEGILIADDNGYGYTNAKIDAYPDGSGFMVSYLHGSYSAAAIEARGFDMNGNLTWNKQINSVNGHRIYAKNNTGFHNGQNILAWLNRDDGTIYGQNIVMNGTMGPTASVNENGSSLSASIFQNGSNLIISSESLSQVEIISITGQSIKTVKANGNAAEINVSGMTKGLYIVRMNDADGNVMVRKTVIR